MKATGTKKSKGTQSNLTQKKKKKKDCLDARVSTAIEDRSSVQTGSSRVC